MSRDPEFAGRTVLVTGAAGGQGRAVALAFAQRGANVVAFDRAAPLAYPAYLDRPADGLDTLGQQVRELGVGYLAQAGDVRDAGALESLVASATEAFGGVDIVFANAGISAYGYAHELTEDQWDAVLDINLKGAWLTARAVMAGMIARRRGVIIVNSSIAGMRGMNRMAHYAASKWGLIGLTKSLAIELAPHGVRAVSIHPTGVDTPMNDGLAQLEGASPREIAERSAGNLLPVPWVETEDVAALVLYLAGDGARYVTGSQHVLDAGLLTR